MPVTADTWTDCYMDAAVVQEGGVSIPLWPEDQTPGARGRIATDIPSLTPFLPPGEGRIY